MTLVVLVSHSAVTVAEVMIAREEGGGVTNWPTVPCPEAKLSGGAATNSRVRKCHGRMSALGGGTDRSSGTFKTRRGMRAHLRSQRLLLGDMGRGETTCDGVCHARGKLTKYTHKKVPVASRNLTRAETFITRHAAACSD